MVAKLDRRDFWANLADIFVLWSLAVAQPIYGLLAQQPEFFVARGAGTMEMLTLVLVLSFVLPLLLFAGKTLLSVEPRFGYALHLLIVAGLVSLLIFPPLKRSLKSGSLTVFMVCLALGLVAAAAYLHYRRRALSLVVFLPVVPLLAGIFLFSSSIRGLLGSEADELTEYPEVSADAPIVILVFDEFPVTSLMNEKMDIDAGRYPNFAQLATRATWYRNASTVAESTPHSIPAILDGMYPDPDRGRLPIANDHPHSLFTLLAGSYRFNVIESTTSICPKKLQERIPFRRSGLKSWISDVTIVYLHIVLPSRLASRLPDISHSWTNFGAERLAPLSESDHPEYILQEFLSRIEPSDSTVNFLHTSVPHFPWKYLPSGRRYRHPEGQIRGTIGTNDVGEDPSRWTSDQAAVWQAQQRHLLQVGMADWVLGKLLERLNELGIYDDCLLVVTADHGTSFRVNDSRRMTTATNYAEIIAVPLFIKAPNQDQGIVDDRNVETIDILPTVADLLDIEMPWKTDGISAENRSLAERAQKHLIADRGVKLEFDARLSARVAEVVKEQSARFGTGDWEKVFRFGLPAQLASKPVSQASVALGKQRPVIYQISDEAAFRNFDPTADVLTTVITGELDRRAPDPFVPLKLIVSINDRAVASTESYLEAGTERFSAVASESDFVRGPNHVELFALNEAAGGLVLDRMQRRTGPAYELGTKLTFGESGNVAAHLISGWSFPEKDFRWNDGKVAALSFPMRAPETPVLLTAELSAFVVPGKTPWQRLRVLVDQEPVGEWLVDHREFRERSMLVERKKFKDPENVTIRFEAPDAIAPHAVGLGPDIRRLAFAIRSLTLSPGKEKDVYSWGSRIEFGTRGNSSSYLVTGWAAPEEGINWNDGATAELSLNVTAPSAPVVLEMFARPFLVPGKIESQRLRLTVNHKPVREVRLTEPDFQEIQFEIPAASFQAAPVTVTLEMPDAKTPREIGAGMDERRLGIAVRTIRFRLKGQ